MFNENIVLENDLVRLEPLDQAHLEKLEVVALEPELWEVSTDFLSSREDVRRYIASALERKAAGLAYPFAIYDKRKNAWAGSTRYGNVDLANKRLEIGWTWVGKAFQGSGLNKACKFELLKYAFEKLALNRVEIKTDALNSQSRRAIEKIGGTYEGTLRKHMVVPHNGRVRNTVYYSITCDEWPEIRETVFGEFISR